MADILFLDFETSGLDASRNGIIQAAWLVEHDGAVVCEKCFDVNLGADDELSLQALACNGFTLDRIRNGMSLCSVLTELYRDVKSYQNVYLCGHNIQFDVGFLFKAANKSNVYFCNINFRKILDTLSMFRWMDFMGTISCVDYKLETICKHYSIPIKAHDALEDVRAVRALFHIITDKKK